MLPSWEFRLVWQGWSSQSTWNWKMRSEEHTSEFQSHHDLVCRLLLEKKKKRRRQCRGTERSARNDRHQINRPKSQHSAHTPLETMQQDTPHIRRHYSTKLR